MTNEIILYYISNLFLDTFNLVSDIREESWCLLSLIIKQLNIKQSLPHLPPLTFSKIKLKSKKLTQLVMLVRNLKRYLLHVCVDKKRDQAYCVATLFPEEKGQQEEK